MKQSTPTDRGLCLPGETAWELWKQTPGGWQRAQVEETGASGPSAFKTASTFGYPVSAVFAVPIRTATSDPELLPGLVDIQLERQGLKPETPVGRLTDYRVVEREENQTLVSAAVLNPERADDLPRETPDRFEITPWLYDLPEYSLVIWKELGRVVFAVTGAEYPAYFHALTEPQLDLAAVQEIEHLMMPLFTQNLVPGLREAVLWTEATPEAERALVETLGLRTRKAPRPNPTLPRQVSAIEPVSVAMGKIRAAQARRVRNIALACVAVYLLLPAFFLARHLLKQNEIRKLEARVAALERGYGWVEPTLETAREIEETIDSKKYPVELLFQALGPLYRTATPGVRITSFEIEKGRGENRQSQITIKGEAANGNTQAAIVYGTEFRKNPALSEFDWKYKAEQQRDGKVPFTITGITSSGNDTTQTQ